MVAEASQIIKTMWTEEKASFKGRHYEIEEAYCYPKPVQKPHPPIMIAGSGEQLTLKTVARHADWSNFSAWFGSPEAFSSKVGVLSKHCDTNDFLLLFIGRRWRYSRRRLFVC
jgi:alkanesulfonate monooxygenase SsuD/methylene tetrahydromethanopterin reductase-like flavin-dependent oxidoreductase (luciferase family)